MELHLHPTVAVAVDFLALRTGHHRALRAEDARLRRTTPDDVTECVADSSGLHQVSRHYTSLCDPRLNPWQALSAVMAWSGAEAIPSATFPLETVA